MNKKIKLILSLIALIELGVCIIYDKDTNKYWIQGNSSIFGTIESEDMVVSENEIIEIAETYCKPYN